MRHGHAAFAPSFEHAGRNATYELHHKIPVSQSGEVYNLDNIFLTTPKHHIRIHNGTKK